jgi:hypothetical protein
MFSRTFALSLVALLGLPFLAGCNNTLNPLCGSARPAPIIGALSPSSLTFAQVQAGATVTVTGSQFVSSTVVLINGKTLAANVTSAQKLTVKLTSGEISGPGTVNVAVQTPAGGSSDVGCSSGGTSSALALTIN